MRNRMILGIIVFALMVSSLAVPKMADAGKKSRHVPPSTSPADGKDASLPKERQDITPKDAKGYKHFLNPNGTYTLEINPVEEVAHPLSANLKKTVASTYGPARTDSIALVNNNGTTVTYPYPSLNCYIQNSQYTQVTPPPPIQVTKLAESFVKYSWSGFSGKYSITEASLLFSGGNTCSSPLTVAVHDVGTSWTSSGMTWNSRPTMDSSTLVNSLSYPGGTSPTYVNVLSSFLDAYYSGTQIGFGFRIDTQNATNCGIASNYPALVITYATLQGGSPSGQDFSFGNGAGPITVNSWTGDVSLSQFDLGFSAKGSLGISLIRTYNSTDTVNYGLGVGWTSNLHQLITVNPLTHVATWRTGSGEYKSFDWDSQNSAWKSPQFSRLTLVSETNSGINYYTITDKYGKKLWFLQSTGNLAKITSRYGGEVNLSWTSSKIDSILDSSTNNGLTFTYDAYSRLTDVEDPEGRTVSYTYDGNNRLVTLTDPESGYIDYTYDGTGKLTVLENQLDKSFSVSYTSGIASSVVNSDSVSIAYFNFSTSSTTATDVNNNSSTLTFNVYGYPTAMSLPESVAVSYVRDNMMQITSVTDPKSNVTSYTYDTNGNVLSVTRPGNVTTSFQYDSNNNLTLFTDARGKETSFTYSSDRLSTVTNELGQESSYSYANGLLVGTTTPSPTGTGTASWGVDCNAYNYPNKVTSPGGREYQYTTDKTGVAQTYTDPMGNTWTYAYNSRGQLISVTSPQNTVWVYTYDGAGRLVMETDPLGGDTRYTYDNNGNLVKITNELGQEVEMHRRTDGRIDWVDDPMNKRTSYNYDALGRVTKVTSPTGEETEFTYDANSNITSVTDPRDKTMTLTYDTKNHLTKITDPKNHDTDMEYDAAGNLTKITNEQSKSTEFYYDDLGRMWKVKNALNDEWTRSWNNAGKLVGLDAPNTALQEFVYNIDGLMTNSEDSNGKSQTYGYNPNGKVTSITDPLGNESNFEYDSLNRLTRAYDPVDNYMEYTYDAVGNCTTFRDRRGNEWDYEYDAIYRLKKITDPLTNVREYVYNDNSKVTQVKKPPAANPPTANFGYDNSSRMNSYTDELGRSASITYTNGLVSSVSDRKSQTFSFSYDDLGLLTEISMPNSQEITFDYDSLNRLTSFTDLIGTTEFTYDDIGRLTTTTDPYDFTHEIEYNAESMITSLTADTDERTYTWDTSGRMTEATRNSLTTEYTYNDASWVTKIDYPNSTNTNYTYNSRGWMTAIDLKDSNNNTIFSLPYTYDANGNVTQETIGNDTISYTYDALNRLTLIDRPGTTNDTTYTYDERGNRTEMETGSATSYLTFNAADRLTRVDKPSNAYDTYTYDGNGNLTQMDRYYPTPFLNNSPKTDKTMENSTENRNTLLMTHYPSDYLPSPENKWDSLSPYLPDLSKIDPLSAKLSQFFPEKAKFDRQERLRRLNRPDPTPDETTSFTYSSDNNLTHADLPDGSDLDFAYDAAGRRLEKKYSKTVNNVAYETKYTYHYIGSQITTIDIQGKEDETITKNDQMRIHLGANSRPISFEYYTDIGSEQEASETYYYHYDLHGNVIRVTDDAGATEITYAYDALGTIVSETNTNSIYNPFTWSGEAQIIHDPEFNTTASSPVTGLYNSGSGYYNPETGTFLSGTGAPADVNPTSASAEEPTAQSTRPASQLGIHAGIAAVAGGVPVSAAPATSTDVTPEPEADKTPIIGIFGGDLEISYIPSKNDMVDPELTKFNGRMAWAEQHPCDNPGWGNNYSFDGSPHTWDPEWMKAYDMHLRELSACKDDDARRKYIAQNGLIAGSPLAYAAAVFEQWMSIPEDVRSKMILTELSNNLGIQMAYFDKQRFDRDEADKFLSDWILYNIILKLEWVAWGVMQAKDKFHEQQYGKSYLFGYQLKDKDPHFFFGGFANTDAQHRADRVSVGDEVKFTTPVYSCREDSCTCEYGEPLADSFVKSWSYHTIYSINNTGEEIIVNLVMNMVHEFSSIKKAIVQFTIPIDNGIITDLDYSGVNSLPNYLLPDDPYGTCYMWNRRNIYQGKKYYLP